jgi:hypothetical protein
MNSTRKILGLLVIVFFGIPTLFGIIWAVGMTRAAVSPELLSDLPQEIINEAPYVVDDMYKAMQQKDAVSDENAREWINAAQKSGFSPRDLMKEIGLMGWLKNELSHSLQQVGEMLRGEIPTDSIILDFRPLKRALQHEGIEREFMNILDQLPPCTVAQQEIWDGTVFDQYHDDHISIPACKPSAETIRESLQTMRHDIEEDIPDEVDIFENVDYFPRGLSISKVVVSLTYLLFLIPIAFIFLGSIIAAPSKTGFLRWSGASTIVGGLSALLLALFAKNVTNLFVYNLPYEYSSNIPFDIGEIIFDNLGGMFNVIFDKLFSPVIAVAGTVCVVGVILFALSYAFTVETRSDAGSDASQNEVPPESGTSK